MYKNETPVSNLTGNTIAYEYTHDRSSSEAAVATGFAWDCLNILLVIVWKVTIILGKLICVVHESFNSFGHQTRKFVAVCPF